MPSLNVGNYIEECINSVVNQTLTEIEIICVDAGSDDGTLDVLEKYAEKDSRITLLHSDKRSYGFQVNLGFSQATGEYISIIETDDYIEEDMFESLYNLTENSSVDIVKGTFYNFDDSDSENVKINVDNVKKTIKKDKFTLEEVPKFLDGHPSIWAGIYRRNFLEEHDIKMKEVPGGGWVDNPFFYETALLAKSIVYIHKPFYHYRVSNEDSSSNKFPSFTLPMERVMDMFEILENSGCDDVNILIPFYNRLFRYIEIILENNENSYLNLDYETCLSIQNVLEKVDVNIVKTKLRDSYKKIYFKFSSPLFLYRFNE